MRAVAKSCGITVGNLQYYFPDLQTLVGATIEEAMELYRQQFERQLADLPLSETKHFVDLMRWLVEDSADTTQGRLFRTFYELDSHYPTVSAAMTKLYAELTLVVARKMKKAFPKVRINKLREVTWMMALFAEGATVLATEQQRSNRRFVSQLAHIACAAVETKLQETIGKSKA